MQRALKFRYSENGTTIWKNLLILFDTRSTKGWDIFSIFVAFSKYLNFKVEKIYEDSLDSIPSPSVKIQIIGRNVYLE